MHEKYIEAVRISCTYGFSFTRTADGYILYRGRDLYETFTSIDDALEYLKDLMQK